MLVHEAHHPVVDGDVLAHERFVDEVRVKPVCAEGLTVTREVGVLLLREGKVRGHVIELAGRVLRVGDVVGVVHRVPRLRDEVGRVRVVEVGHDEEWPAVVVGVFDVCDGALGGPGGVVEFLGEVPLVPSGFFLGVGRPLAEVVAPVGEPLLFHPQGVVGAGHVFVGVAAGGFEVLEPVERSVERAPEIEVAQLLGCLDRFRPGCRARGLKVTLADHRREIPRALEVLTHRRDVLGQLHADGPRVVPRRVESGNHAGP